MTGLYFNFTNFNRKKLEVIFTSVSDFCWSFTDCSELHGFKGDPIKTINKTKCYLYVKEITICVDILLDILQQKLYEKYHIFSTVSFVSISYFYINKIA